jgi:lysosomal Pro-X carboxypeptidase
MWEHAAEHGAVMVFAEHRYYGATTVGSPHGSPPGSAAALRYLTMDNALADYATLIRALPDLLGTPQGLPVIAFGGSYGGMLAAWLRMKCVV